MGISIPLKERRKVDCVVPSIDNFKSGKGVIMVVVVNRPKKKKKKLNLLWKRRRNGKVQGNK